MCAKQPQRDGVGFKSFAVFLKETWVQSLGWEDPLEKRTATQSSILGFGDGGLLEMRLGEVRTASRWGPSPPLLPQPCQPRAPGLASPARATWAGEPLLPMPEIPPHSHSLISLVLCTCRDSIHRRNSWAEVVRTHVCTNMHTQGLELPASIPPRADAGKKDYESRQAP